MVKVVLGYWKIRGLAQYLRHLLSHTGTEFEEVQYADPNKWFKEDKVSLGFDFPNIPYLIDGDFKLTESSAIAKYIINRSGHKELLGKNAADQGEVDNIIGVINDILKEGRGLFFNPKYQELASETFEKLRTKFDSLKKFVGDRQFALGYLTLVDFVIAENLYYLEGLFAKQIQEQYGFLGRIRHNVESLAGVQAYYKRPDAVVAPFLPPSAPLQPKARGVTIGYWGIRGLAQTPRHLLGFIGVKFENLTYTSAEGWFEGDKKTLPLNFPNIPYIIDGDFTLTESTAIQRYIINKFGKPELLGKNPQDNARL